MQTAFHAAHNNDKMKNRKMKKPDRSRIQKDRKKIPEESKRLNKPEIHTGQSANICSNFSCRMRKAGCRGFEGCPGYLAK
jgi:hypothetical protein